MLPKILLNAEPFIFPIKYNSLNLPGKCSKYSIPLLLNEKTHSTVCKLICTYSRDKIESKWRTSVMKDLIQAWTDDVFNGNFFNRRAQTCIFKSWINK